MPRLYDHFILSVFVVILCGPVVWVFAQVLSADIGTAVNHLQNVGPGFWAMATSTLALAFGVSLLSTALSFATAFALVFCRLRFAPLVFWLSLATFYFPIEARMLQTFDLASHLSLTNTLPGLILPTLQLALGTLFFRQHFKRMSPELVEAARLDEANPLTFLKDFAIPLSSMPIGTVALITFISGWNQYLWPLMLSIDDRHWTIVRGLEHVRAGSVEGLLLAMAALLPPLVLILVLRMPASQLGQLQSR